ncbi:hypothetical protein [Streptomyces herbicida]|uniref:hypothetical protein n=1 Tax=Streptomyces herbicida TaxID=3065675 RepID=UPI00292F930C|nr:hypothetical protein [Streptomyces sp. NEAU-HV9]
MSCAERSTDLWHRHFGKARALVVPGAVHQLRRAEVPVHPQTAVEAELAALRTKVRELE